MPLSVGSVAGGGGAALAAAVLAAIAAVVAPYLARLTLTVPDCSCRDWWRGRPRALDPSATDLSPPDAAAPDSFPPDPPAPDPPDPSVGRRRVAATLTAGVVLGLLGGAAAGTSALLPAFAVLVLLGAPLVVIDFAVHRLPNRLVVPLAAAGAVTLAFAAVVRHEEHALLRAAEGAAVVFAVLFALHLAAPRGFGRGDVNLGGVLGGYLGYASWGHVYYGIFAGFLLGALLAVPLLLSRRATLKTAIPFGPMMLVGALLVLAFDLVPSGF